MSLVVSLVFQVEDGGKGAHCIWICFFERTESLYLKEGMPKDVQEGRWLDTTCPLADSGCV